MEWTLITNTEYDNNNWERIEFQGLTELKAFTTYTPFQQKSYWPRKKSLQKL